MSWGWGCGGRSVYIKWRCGCIRRCCWDFDVANIRKYTFFEAKLFSGIVGEELRLVHVFDASGLTAVHVRLRGMERDYAWMRIDTLN